MSLPRKLNPDNLKDTLVEIRYAQGIPQELILGFASSILEPLGYQYLPVPNQTINIALDINPQIAFGAGINSGGFFIKDDVRIQFISNQVVFNCMADKYAGWEKYFQIISDIISNLFDKKAIKDFNRVSVRYISEFKNIDIYRGIKGTVDLSNAGLKLDNSILRLVDESDNLKTYVTLTNKARRISASPQGQKIIEASLIDINVYENFNPVSDLNILINKLNQIHAKQKEVFFGLISDDFLNTLNPEY
ncbi:MAG: TIGR04255 family protein [Bacteroidales bacterium]|jgi:uncharacterized protein (TIGR04255 family)|nr:TIGR04255 family protein [Bacteroidales bacterium]